MSNIFDNAFKFKSPGMERVRKENLKRARRRAAGSALDAMHGIAFLQKQLSKVAAVLSGDAGYEGLFAVAHDCHCCWWKLSVPDSSSERNGGKMSLEICAPSPSAP